MNFTAAKFLVVNLVGICCGGLLNTATLSAADRIRIGLSSFTPINAAVWIADDKGLFKKYGIDSEVVLMAARRLAA